MAVDAHYENFPVASLLLPRSLRPHVTAIYRFARHADDVADEGDATPAARRTALQALATDVEALFAGAAPEHVAAPTVRGLAALRDAAIPGIDAQPFLDLLSAFMQDTDTLRYATHAALLDYCRRSANPVGRLLLALVGVGDAASLAASDQICSALQLINFWQDAAIDATRGRLYVPLEDFAHHRANPDDFPSHPRHRALMHAQCARAEAMMAAGSRLLPALRGRFRLEIAFTIAGGQRILQKIAANDYDVRIRPRLRWYDAPWLIALAWRAWRRSQTLTP